MRSSLKPVNDAVRFLVELAAVSSIAYWGFHDHASWLAKLLLGVGGPVVIASAWAVWMAPRSSRRAREGARVLLELVIFGLATAALAASTGATLAIIFAVVAGTNAVLDHALARPTGSTDS